LTAGTAGEINLGRPSDMNPIRCGLLRCAAALAATGAALASTPGLLAAQTDPPTGLAGAFALVISREVRALNHRREHLSQQLWQLPLPAGADTSARLGWHSKSLPAPDSETWLRLDLGAAHPLDFVALAPATGEGTSQSEAGYGFPRRFRIDVADNADFTGAVTLGDFTAADVPNPGAFPLVVRADGRRARFVRVTCTKAWPRRDDWIVALGEIIVLSGPRNVAAGATVQASSSITSLPAWSHENLTDGQSLLGPPVSREPSPSNGFLARHERAPDAAKWVQVDLGAERPIDEVRLFPARPTDFADAPGSGFPVRFRIEAAADEAFTAARTIFTTGDADFLNPGDNAVSFPAVVSARHVRVSASRLQGRGSVFTFGLAEMQVWSGGTNATLGAPVRASDLFDNPQFPRWQPEYLVDGFNSRRRILDWGEWLEGLERRRQIQAELAALEIRRAAASGAALALAAKIGAGTTGGLLLLAAGLLWRARAARRREVEQLRTRIASDLHDEIGSQLGSIALAAQLAGRRADDPAATREQLAEIERIARETNEAMHDIVWLLKPGSANLAELLARLREAAARQLRGRDLKIECPSQTAARPVTLDFTRNVYLLFKEALTNIANHSRAKSAAVAISLRDATLCVRVSDDGVGFDPAAATAGNGLANMRRRADEIGATLRIVSAPGQGTTITLEAPLR
jgi:signal transduction histidine kinase